MAFYKFPVNPIDPVVRDNQQEPDVIHYLRDNFYEAGQDSYAQPFSQDQSLFERLTNVLPTGQGIFKLRYGYSLFNNPAIGTIDRIYSYQNLNDNLRKLVLCAGSGVDICNEDGTGVSNILTSTNSTAPRMVMSRDYGFFPSVISPFTWPSGQQSDGKKVHVTSGGSTTTDWGLASPPGTLQVTSTATAGNITLVSTLGRVYSGAYLNSTTGHYSDINVASGSFTSTSVGPSNPGTAASVSFGSEVWANPNNAKTEDATFASSSMTCEPGVDDSTDQLLLTNFGFAVPSTATVVGVQVRIKRRGITAFANTHVVDESIHLVKTGSSAGDNKASTSNWTNGTAEDAFYGGADDTWSVSLTPADVNAVNFGVSIFATGTTTNVNGGNPVTISANVDVVQVTVYYQSGGGVNTGAITSKEVALNLPTSNPPAGVDRFAILATLDGGDTSTFYLLDTVPIAQTTYIDNTPDTVLVTKNRATEVDDFGIEHGLINNQMPPVGLQFPTKHKGRFYGLVGDILWFSKNLDEITTSTGLVLGRYEEAWPLTYNMPISTEAETGRGLLSDGNVLYIGTERHIWRLDGDGPLNFSKPEVIFNEVGIVNQDVWQICFAEGSPVGMIWLTPDNRVIQSNFSTYHDIGTQIQDVLNTVNASATIGPWGQFYSQQGYDIYILAIPTGSNNVPDTLCVYDLRGQRWYIWAPTDTLSAGHFNINAAGTPQWLIAANSGKIYQFSPTATQDRVGDTPVSFSSTIRTVWMHLGEPSKIKLLNWLEMVTGDPNISVTIEGATTSAQALASPRTVVSNATAVTSPEGRTKLFLAGKTSKDRYYRFTFISSAGIASVLQSFLVEAVPVLY